MLNKLEKSVMLHLYERAIKKESVLIDPNSIVVSLLPKFKITKKELDKIIKNLALDNYIEVINTEDKSNNKTIYCICLMPKGEAFKREMLKEKKTNRYLLARKLLLTISGVFLGLLLRSIVA